VTRRTRGNHHSRRAISTLAFVVSHVVLVTSWPGTADAAHIPPAHSPVPPGPEAPTDIPATGNSSRTVVRIGALLFALGSIATYVASGTRRNAVREVDLDGHDL
jgi:hypothetical protein